MNVKRVGKEVENKPLKEEHHLAATQSLGVINVESCLSRVFYLLAGLQLEPGRDLRVYGHLPY